MNEIDDTGFKIRIDDDNPDELLRDEPKERKTDTSNRKLTYIAIFLLGLIGIAVGVAYMDIQKRLAASATAGNAVVNRLSEHMESKLSLILSK